MRGLGDTPPLFRLTMPRVTVNEFWITDQKSSSAATCSALKCETLFEAASTSCSSAAIEGNASVARPMPLPAIVRKSRREVTGFIAELSFNAWIAPLPRSQVVLQQSVFLALDRLRLRLGLYESCFSRCFGWERNQWCTEFECLE